MLQSKLSRRLLILTVSVSLSIGLCMIAQSAILATVIDQVYLHHATRPTLISLLILFLMIVCLRAGLNYLRERFSFQTATIIKNHVRKKCFSYFMQLSPAKLSEHKTGALTSTLLEQIEALHGFYADYLPQMMITVILPIIILGFVFSQNWLAGVILLITGPLIPLFMALIGMGAAKLNQENFQLLARLSAHFLDILQGLTTLSLFNRARAQTESIETISNDFRDKTMRVLRIAFLSSAALELFSTISIAIIAVYLGLGLLGLIHVGFSGVHITLQQALFILLLAPEFFMPLRQLGAFYHARAQAMGAANEIMGIGNRGSGIVSTNNTIATKQPITLTVNNLSFIYSNNRIFNDFSLTIPFGSCIAITGPSGVGKSTLLQLIAKLNTPSGGKILANTINIDTIDDDDWREHVTLLHQHPRLQVGTIADNIRIAKPNATDAEVMHAAEQAGVTAFSPHLTDLIYEHNTGLSGGQIQRVALARIILRDAAIVLLDEPTNYLDQSNITILWKLITQWKNKKTIIIATHDEKIINEIQPESVVAL